MSGLDGVMFWLPKIRIWSKVFIDWMPFLKPRNVQVKTETPDAVESHAQDMM